MASAVALVDDFFSAAAALPLPPPSLLTSFAELAIGTGSAPHAHVISLTTGILVYGSRITGRGRPRHIETNASTVPECGPAAHVGHDLSHLPLTVYRQGQQPNDISSTRPMKVTATRVIVKRMPVSGSKFLLPMVAIEHTTKSESMHRMNRRMRRMVSTRRSGESTMSTILRISGSGCSCESNGCGSPASTMVELRGSAAAALGASSAPTCCTS